jgi:hypothetical protein
LTSSPDAGSTGRESSCSNPDNGRESSCSNPDNAAGNGPGKFLLHGRESSCSTGPGKFLLHAGLTGPGKFLLHAGLEALVVPGVGHWVQQEAPRETTELLLRSIRE